MKKKTKLIIVAVVVVIAVIAGSLGAYLGYFKPHKEAVDAYLRKYGICRICFRELAYKGQIPGVKKASW